MKMFYFFLSLILFSMLSDLAYSQDSSNSAKIIFMRSTGFQGSATAFTTFIDDNLVCRLNNKRFSTHFVQPGEHTISVQFAGQHSKAKAERVKIQTDPGKTYFVQLIFQPGLLVNNLYCQEVTKNSADLILPMLKEDKKCL